MFLRNEPWNQDDENADEDDDGDDDQQDADEGGRVGVGDDLGGEGDDGDDVGADREELLMVVVMIELEKVVIIEKVIQTNHSDAREKVELCLS